MYLHQDQRQDIQSVPLSRQSGDMPREQTEPALLINRASHSAAQCHTPVPQDQSYTASDHQQHHPPPHPTDHKPPPASAQQQPTAPAGHTQPNVYQASLYVSQESPSTPQSATNQSQAHRQQSHRNPRGKAAHSATPVSHRYCSPGNNSSPASAHNTASQPPSQPPLQHAQPDTRNR